jgi:hypothetical protein
MSLWGGLAGYLQGDGLGAAQQMQGGVLNQQMQGYAQQAMNNQAQALPTFSENVPDSELEYEGILIRLSFMAHIPRQHSINFCQRCLML